MHVRSIYELREGDDELVSGDRRCVGQALGLGDEIDDVHPEAVDAAVEPPNHDVLHRFSYLRVLPVQIRLLAGEQVQVVLAGGGIPLPRRAGEE